MLNRYKKKNAKPFVSNRKKSVKLLRLDPTRTTMLRREFEAQLSRRFAILKGIIVKTVLHDDALGIKLDKSGIHNQFCPTGPGGGVDPHCSPSGGESLFQKAQHVVEDFLNGKTVKIGHDSGVKPADIHSPEFKQWFGDWERDPQHCSKVTDAKGVPEKTNNLQSIGSEVHPPVPVYHGSLIGGFNAFDKSKLGDDTLWGKGIYCTTSKEIADAYATHTHKLDEQMPAETKPETKQLYLKVVNPIDLDKPLPIAKGEELVKRLMAIKEESDSRDPYVSVYQTTYQRSYKLPALTQMDAHNFPLFVYPGNIFESARGRFGSSTAKVMTRVLQELGYDGVVRNDNWAPGVGTRSELQARTWVAFEPTQAKSVLNRGTFRPDDPILTNELTDNANPEGFNQYKKCFACGKKLGKSKHLVDTGEDQVVCVGSECAKLIETSGKGGYKPPKGGPTLRSLTDERRKYFESLGLLPTDNVFDLDKHPKDRIGRFAKKGAGEAALPQEKVGSVDPGASGGDLPKLGEGWRPFGAGKAASFEIMGRQCNLYHGTTSQFIESIKRSGLQPGKGLGADAWAAKQGMALHNASIEGRTASVYVTPNKIIAEQFANTAVAMNGGKPVLFKIVPPSPQALKEKGFYQDEFDSSGTCYRIRGNIPPEWISGIRAAPTRKLPGVSVDGKILQPTSNSGPTEFHCVVVCYDPTTNENSNHDEKGRFASTSAFGGGAAHALYQKLKEKGGFTYQPMTHDSPTTGMAVSSFQKAERVFAADKITEDDIVKYLQDNIDKFNDPTAHFGAWLDTEANKVYLDLSSVVKTPEEATRIAQQHNQEAYYDLGEKRTVIVKRAEERRLAHTANYGASQIEIAGTFEGIREGSDGAVENQFCATGPGGGVDATCGNGAAAAQAPQPATPKDAAPKEPAKEFSNTKEADAYGEAVVKNGDFDESESKGLEDYRQSGLFYKIQNYARGRGLIGVLGLGSSAAKAAIKNIDSAIAKSKTTEDLTVHRGMTFSGHVDISSIPGFDKEGQTIKDKAFVSTTLSKDVATRFATSVQVPSTSIIIKSTISKGSNCVKMKREEGKYDEAEVLLGRGSKFKVAKITMVDDGKKSGRRQYMIETEYAGASPTNNLLLEFVTENVKATAWPAARFLWKRGDIEVDGGDEAVSNSNPEGCNQYKKCVPSVEDWQKVQTELVKQINDEDLKESCQLSGICVEASQVLQARLAKMGIKTRQVGGRYGEPRDNPIDFHSWLEAEDGTIIDGSLGQYEDDVKLGEIRVFPRGSKEAKKYVEEKGMFDDPTNNMMFEFMALPEKVSQFQHWLMGQVENVLTSATEESFWRKYIETGFKKGAGRAFDDVRKPYAKGYAKKGKVSDFYKGTKAEFLRSSFGLPVSLNRVKALADRAFEELKNVTADMANRISRGLVDGLIAGEAAEKVAKRLTDAVDISKDRAKLIAQTELIRAHAEGQLNSMEQMGVDEVEVAVEWATAEDNKVCPKCKPMQGVVLKITEAHGLIPRHPRAVLSGSTFIPYGECREFVRAKYSGPCIILTTSGAGKNRTTIGPNHPMLTARGMVKAADLRKGDKVLYDLRADFAPDGSTLDNKKIPLVEDAFQACEAVSEYPLVSSPGSDFHGDREFCKGKVEAVFPANGLLFVLDSRGVEKLRKDNFVGADVEFKPLSSNGSGDKNFIGINGSDSGDVGVSDLVGSLSRGHSRPLNEFGGGLISQGDPHFNETPSNCSPVCSVELGKGVDGFSQEITINEFFIWKVVHDVTPAFFEGLAFDCTTATSLYCSDGFVVSNCRCAWLPANLGEDQANQIRSKSRIVAALIESGLPGVQISQKRPESMLLNYEAEIGNFDDALLRLSYFLTNTYENS